MSDNIQPPFLEESLAFRALARKQLQAAAEATFDAAMQAPSPAKSGAVAGKRSVPFGGAPNTARVTLIETAGGQLRWEYEAVAGTTPTDGAGAALRSVRRAYARRGAWSRNVVASTEVAVVGPNRVTEAIASLDERLTPARGLRVFREGKLQSPPSGKPFLAGAERVLVFIHGTFSKGEMYEEQLGASQPGREFLARAEQTFEYVLSFDHPTLSVSPMLNALDLERALQAAGLPNQARLDLVCHSRGGLVASWWLQNSRYSNVGSLVAVGAPLAGTSLASPYRISYLLDYFANYARMLGRNLGLAAQVPTFASGFLAGAGGLMGILGGVVGGMASTPLADAGIALVPGLHSMSRVTNNLELARLWNSVGTPDVRLNGKVRCYVINSNFEPAPVNAPFWELWKHMKALPWQTANGLADKLFPMGNDLVVDTECMKFAEAQDILEFAPSDAVHHCNYFQSYRTIEKLGAWLL